MLKKQFRIPSFRLNHPTSAYSDSFTFKYSVNNESLSRFGFVVSKKFDSRAVYRNEAKRKIRSCIEEIFDNIKPGYDFIFYPKLELAKKTRAEVLEEVKINLGKLKLLNE